jgi:hypothetical protein
MKPRKDLEKPTPTTHSSAPEKRSSNKSIQELTEQINHIIGKNPEKAAKVIENWVKDPAKPKKKAS